MTIVFSSVTEVDLSCRASLLGICDVMEAPAVAAAVAGDRRDSLPPQRPPRRRRPQIPATARPRPQVAPPVLRLLGPAPAQRAAPSPSQPPEGAVVGDQRSSSGPTSQTPLKESLTVDRLPHDESREEPSRLPPLVDSKTITSEWNRTVPSKPPVPPPLERVFSKEGHTRVFRTKSAPGGHQAKLSVFPMAAGTPVEVTVLRSSPNTNGIARSALSNQGSVDDASGTPGRDVPRQRQPVSAWPTQTVTWGLTSRSLTPGAYNQYLRPVNGHCGTYHKDSYMAHRRDWRQGLGHEGRYRRTQSPSPPTERRRPSWPVSLSPPTIARSVSYAAPSRQSQQLTPLRLPQPASTSRLNSTDDTEEWQSCASGSQSTAEPPSPSSSLTPSAVSQPSPSGSLNLLQPESAAARGVRPRHHSAGAVCSDRRLSAIPIEVTPPPPESDSESESESGAGQGQKLAEEEAETARAAAGASAAKDDVFATPPTALPEEDTAESDNGEIPLPNKVEEETKTPATNNAAPAVITATPPPPTPSPMPMSPPPAPSPSRPSQRRGSADLLSVTHPSAGVNRRPSLPVYAADRSPGHVMARSGARSPIQLPVNGVHRPSRVAAGLAWADRHGVRQSARDLLDPCRLPEATARQQERWEDRRGSGTDESTADISWSSQLDLMSTTLTVTSHQVGVGRRIPLIVTTPADPAVDITLSPSSESSVSDSDSNTPDTIRRRQTELSARISRQLAVLREEQRAVEEEVAANAALGAAVAARVEQLARPSEAERYRASVEQVTTITSLLMGLAGRLARTEAALAALPDHCPEEKALLTSKRDKLSDQLTEARQLEEGVRRRRRLVDTCLERYLSKDELSDHRHFVQTKAKLIRDARQIEDKIRRGEEQLAALSRVALGT